MRPFCMLHQTKQICSTRSLSGMEEIRNRQLHEEPCFQKQHLGLLYSQSGEVSGEELLPKVTSIH